MRLHGFLALVAQLHDCTHLVSRRTDRRADKNTFKDARAHLKVAVDNFISQKTGSHDILVILTAPKRISKNCRFIGFPNLNL